MAAADQILEILTAARGIKILVTSRERLNLYGEHNFEIPPLSLTTPDRSIGASEVRVSDAVLLFLDRAQALDWHFALTAENARVLRHICDRLDGLPLAAERATIASDRFTPAMLLDRLDARLQVLVGGHRSLPDRHQTLQAAIDW